MVLGSVGAVVSGPPAGGSASRADVERVPGRAREPHRWQRPSSLRTPSSC